VVNPLRLDKLKLSSEVCPDECENQASVSPVIFEDALWKERSVSSSASYHSMYPCHACDLCVAWIRSPDVRAARRLEPVRVVIPKEKVVVAARVCAQFWVVVKRAECQRRAASPTPHHLRRHQLLIFGPFGVSFQVTAKLGHALV